MPPVSILWTFATPSIAGTRRMVGACEDMIIDVALVLKAAQGIAA